MTVQTQKRTTSDAVSAGVLEFQIDYPFHFAADIIVEHQLGNTFTPLVLDGDFTAAPNDSFTGGTLTLLSGFTSGFINTERMVTPEQKLNTTEVRTLRSLATEQQLDRLVMAQIDEAGVRERLINRAFLVPKGQSAPPIPEPAEGMYLAWQNGVLVNRAGVADDTNLIFLQDGSGAVLRQIADKGRERKTLLDFIPVLLHPGIIAGTNPFDLTVYINRALATGGIIDTLKHTYLIKSRLLSVPGTLLVGEATFKAIFNSDVDKFNDTTGDGLQIMFQPSSDLIVSKGITFDGGSITTAGFWLYGVRNVGPLSHFKFDGTVKNVSFTGLDISRNFGSWQNTDIAVRGRFENCGWIGASMEGCVNLDIDGIDVYRTGWSAISVFYALNTWGYARANKSIPPFRIYDGPGSKGGLEGGFLFAHFSINTCNWDVFLNNNRNAGEDGFGFGEDGVLGDPESTNMTVRGTIIDAGQFGFDVSSNMNFDVKIINPAKQGVQVGLDLGGTLTNITGRAQVIGGDEDEAVRFSATGTATRNCSITNGSNAITVNSGSGFYIAVGQRITGAGMPANAYVGTYNPGTGAITMVTAPGGSTPANATATNGSASLNFRGRTTFRNISIEVDTADCKWGVGIESGLDGYATYENCEVLGDLSEVANDSVRTLNGDYQSGMAVKASKYKNSATGKSGGSFSAIGNDTFNYNGGGTLNYITNGFDKQEITVYANVMDMTINFDWTNAGGWLNNRLIGNGNVDVLLKAGGMFRATYRAGTGWYVHTIVQTN